MTDLLFAIGDETAHVVEDPQCPQCLEAVTRTRAAASGA